MLQESARPVNKFDMCETALWYARGRFPVVPVHTPIFDGSICIGCSCGRPQCVPGGKYAHDVGKHPRTPNGLNDATTDATVINEWWTRWPDANIAILPSRSGLIGNDCDVYKPEFAGQGILNDLLANAPTTTIQTGGGGLTMLYRLPYGVQLNNSSGRLPRGIDVCVNRLIVMPPSLHSSGQRYTFLPGFCLHEKLPKPLPKILLDLLLPLPQKPHTSYTPNFDNYDDTDDIAAAKDALDRLDQSRCDGYDTWVKVGMALTQLGDEGLRLWDEWSRQSTKYQDGVCAQKWASFNGHGIGLGSLIQWANEDNPREQMPTPLLRCGCRHTGNHIGNHYHR